MRSHYGSHFGRRKGKRSLNYLLPIVAILAALFLLCTPDAFAQTKNQSAFLQGTETTAPSSPTNLNQSTAYSLTWSSSDFDSSFFSHSTSTNAERLTVTTTGDYLLAATVPVTSSAQRPSVNLEVFVNGVAVPGAIGESTYIRISSGHTESSAHIALLLPNLSANDYIEVRASQTGNAGTVTVDGTATLYVEHVPNGSRTVFSGTSNSLTSGTDLNVGTLPELQWSQGRNDAGFSHSNSTNPESITLDSAGEYLVFVNVPVTSTVQRANLRLNVRLDGTAVPGGYAQQGYIRNTSGHNDSSLHWSGVVRAGSAGQVLSIATQQESANGVVNFQTGKSASIFVERLPSTKIYAARGTQVTGSSPDNWNPSSAESVLWATDDVIDTSTFSHSTSVNAHEVTILEAGDYLLSYNDSLTSTVQRPNPRVTVVVNGNPVTGAETSSHYIRSSSGHNEASGSLVFLLEDLNANDVVSLRVESEANAGTVNDYSDAHLLLWQKATRRSISGRITRNSSALQGVTVTLSGDVSGSTTTDANGDYTFPEVLGGVSYTVTPSLTGNTFSPTSNGGTLSADTTHDFTATLNTYAISGTITAGGSPLQGVTVSLSGDTSGSTTTDASGNYSFTGINHGTNYTVTPTSSSHDFSPLETSGTLTGAVVHDFTGTLKQFSLNGTITDPITSSPIVGATVSLTGDQTDSTTTDASGNYSFPNLDFGTNYTVTPTLTQYLFTPVSTSGTITGATTHDFTGGALRTISGTIQFGGSPLQGVTVQLSGDETAFTLTDASGNYSFADIPEGTSYTVAPSSTGYSFAPTDGSGTVSGNAIHDFTASISQHVLSGTITVSGAPLAGVTVTLSGDESGSAVTDSNGDYAISGVSFGSNYTLTPTLSGYEFAPVSSSGVVSGDADIDFTASSVFSISGTITAGGNPVAGVTVTLSGDQSDSTTTDGSGNYSFSNISSGASYTVTPTLDGYTFTPTDSTGTLTADADIDFTGVLATYTISGTITVSGLPQPGVSVNLTGDSPSATTTDASGNYSFTNIPYGTNYTVIPQLSGFFYSPLSVSGTLISAADHDFVGIATAGNTKVQNAFLQGSETTAPLTPTNLNQTTAYSLSWSSSAVDNAYFDHPASNPEQLVVKQAGDYFLSATLPVTGTAIHGAIQLEVFVNGNAVSGSVGESAYIRAASGHNESSAHVALLLEGLSVSDYVEVRAQGTAGPGEITVDGLASLYAEAIESGSRTVFSGTSTTLTSGTNLNSGTLPEIKWTQGRADSGFTHFDIVNAEEINLDTAGDYFVSLNVPVSSSSTTVNAKLTVRLEGVTVPGGIASQGYIRNTSGHNDASIHWSGIVRTSAPNQELSIVAEQEAASGAVTIQSGKAASIFIERLPASNIYFGRSTNVTGASPTDWNPASAESALWENDIIIDSGTYSHSTSSNAQQVTVQSGGDYLVIYNSAFSSGTSDTNPTVTINVNGTPLTGAEAKSHYASGLSSHNESSGSLVILLEDLNDGDIVSVTTEAEAATGTVTAATDALLGLWRKSETHLISGTITAGGSPLAGVEVALSGDATKSTTTDASGNYSFTGVLDGASYTVTPTLTGYTFSPTTAAGTLTADVTADFTATLNSYTISGTITDGGSPLAGVSVALSGGASGSTTTDASGNYSFSGVDFGTSYTVTPTLSGYTFTPADVSGTVSDDVTHDFTSQTATHSITGTVTRSGLALAGVTVTLSGGTSGSTTTDANGEYSFTGIAFGTTYTVAPSLAGNTFSPTDSSGTLNGDVVHDFAATLNQHTISGTITLGGSPQSGVSVVLSGDASGLTTTDGSGNYSFTVNYGTNYTVTPSLTAFAFSPTSSTGTVTGNVTHDFTSSNATFTISGNINVGGSPLVGATVNLTGDYSSSGTTDGSGNYSISEIPYGSNFTLTPSLAGYTFSPTNTVGTITSNSQYDFTATLNTYTLSGTILVGGSPLSGVTISLSGDITDSATTDASGNYSFPNLDHGTDYTITPTLTGYTFSPTTATGTLTTATSEDFTAIPNTYTISGRITDTGVPIAGATVSISGDISNNTTTDSNGDYSFTGIAHGTSYTVTPTLTNYFFAPTSTSNVLTGAATHDFIGSLDSSKTKVQSAFLHGTQTTASTNINQSSAALEWSSSDLDLNYFSHSTSSNPERLIIETAGDYFIAATLPTTSAVQRSAVELEVYVNGVASAGSIGGSSYIRNQSSHTEGSSHVALLIPGLLVNDYIEVRVRQAAETGTVTVSGQASLYAEYVPSVTRTVFSATSNTLTSGTNLNDAGQPALEWSEGRKDSGFTHSDSTNPQSITLDSAGDYLVTVNIPTSSTVTRANPRALIRLDGATVPGGNAKQGYIRSDSGHNSSSVHWSGMVRASSAGQVLSIVTEPEAGTGTVTFPSGKSASLFVERLPTTGVYAARGTTVTTGNNWNTDAEVNWSTDDVIDTNVFSHSTSTNPNEVTVLENGDYLLFYNNSLTSTSTRPNPKVSIEVNGVARSGADITSHYIRSDSGHNESSGSLVFLLEDLSANDVVTVQLSQESAAGTVNDDSDAILVLWQKSALNSISGTITLGGNPLSGVTVSLSGDVSDAVVTDASGNYSFPKVISGSNYTVTPILEGYTFSPTDTSGTLSADTVHDFTATLNSYTVSGTITDGSSPLSGVVVSLSGDVTDSTTTDASGNYSFASVPFGTNYTVTPTDVAYDFSPASSSGLVTDAVTHDFTGTLRQYTLSGRLTDIITGQPLVGATVNLTGDVSNSTTTDGSGDFSFSGLNHGTNYTVTPSLASYVFSPLSASGTLNSATSENFVGAALRTISGTILDGGTPVSNVTVQLSGSSSNFTLTDASGNYLFSNITDGSAYTLTPSKTGYDFSPTTATGTVSGSVVEDFTASLSQHVISGTITSGGSPLPGVLVTLSGDESGAAFTDASGNYSITGVSYGSNYTVTPTLNGFEFLPVNSSGVISGDVDADFTATGVFSISGTITDGASPLSGLTVTLSGSESDTATTDVNGNYTFSSIPSGSLYTVTPSLAGYDFSPLSSSGTLTANEDLDFTGTIQTFSISGTATDGGQPLQGVTITLSGGTSDSATTDSSGDYSFSNIPYGTAYTVTPALPGYFFTPGSSSGTLTATADLDFAATVTAGNTKVKNAFLHGTETTDLITPTNLNQSTAYAIEWSSSEVDNAYFEHSSSNPERLIVKQNGDYLVSVTLPVTGSVSNGAVQLEVFLNGSAVAGSISESSYIRNASGHNESTSQVALLLPSLTTNDYVEVRVKGTAGPGTITVNGRASLYSEIIESGTRTAFSGTATTLTSGSDLNVGTFPELSWAEGREDAGFTHSDSTNPEQITFDSAGDYFVYVNVPVSSTSTAVNAKLHVRLDGSDVPGGIASQGFIRNTAGHNESSLHWSGVVRTSSANQVLSIATEQEAGSGTVTLQSGKAASIFIEELPASGVYVGQGSTVTGSSPTDWNPVSAESIQWGTDLVLDGSTFSHSTSSNSHQVTIQSGGDYFFVYNDALSSATADVNSKVRVAVNGTPVSGTESSSHYISANSNHSESSGSIVTLLEDLTAGDIVTITTEQEAASGTITTEADALVALWKKSDTHIISGTITVGGSPLQGVEVALSGDAVRTITTDASGNYSFAGVLDGASYTVTPSLTGYTFSPTSESGTLTADVTHDFTATLNTYSISGTITDGGSPLSGVTVTLSGDVSDSTTTDASGNYSFATVDYGVNYTVTPSLAGYVFTPTDVTATLTDNVVHDFTTEVATYSISGTITRSGSALSGVTITLSGGASDSTTTDISGNYTLTGIPFGTSYTVTPSLAGNTFTPTSFSGTLTANTTHDFTATLNQHTISGTITNGGSPQSGVNVVLSGDVSNFTTTDGSGNYSFTVDYGTSYTVTPSLTGFGYTPSSSNGTVIANITHDFVAGPAVQTISGTITVGGSPLSGVTVSLTGDVTDSATTDGSGNYSISNIPYGTNYTVTPTLTGYSFTPPNAVGTLTADLDLDFTGTLNTYTLSGSIQNGGIGVEGITVNLTGSTSSSTTTDSNGDYTFTNLDHGTTYTLTPSSTGYTFSPTSTSGTLTAAATEDFTASPNLYAVTGTITDGSSPLSGVTISISGDHTDSTTTDGSGNYTLSNVPFDSNYTVTPTLAGYRFSPASSSGTISGATVLDFTGSIIVPADKYGIAVLHGTQSTAPSSPTNINQTTSYPLEWSSSNFDSNFFSHNPGANPEQLTIQRAGDYLISATVPMSSAAQRPTVQIEVLVNGSPLDGSIGESSYIRNIDSHTESSSHVAVLARGLSVNDTIELNVTGTATTGTVLINSQASLYAEYIDATDRTAFSATATRTVGSTNVNDTGASALEWTEGRKDTGITHDDVTNPENITLGSVGSYMVFVNFPVESTIQRANPKMLIQLDGATVPGGVAAQGYIRSDGGHNNSSVHWSGIVTTTSPNQVLTVEMLAEAGSGTATVTTGKVGSIFVEQIDTNNVYFGRGTNLTTGADWNVSPAQAIQFVNDDLIDTEDFTHSTSTDSHEVEIDIPGDYLAVFNSSLTLLNSGASLIRTNPKMTIRLNGSPISGAEAKTHYIRGDSGHQEASTSMVILLESLSAGDKISVFSEQEAYTGENNATDDAQLVLWRKTAPYSISGNITVGGSPLAGVTVTLGDGYSGSTVTDASGNYSFTELADGGTYTVTPSLAGYIFTPTSSSGTLSTDVVHDFTAVLETYDITGTITDGGSPQAGVTVTLSGDVSGSTTTDGSGNYSFTNIVAGSNYTVTPSLVGYTFSPTDVSSTLTANAVHDFTSSIESYTVSGTITVGGLPQVGVSVALTGDVTDSATTDGSGNYSFTLNYGTNYVVTPSLSGFTYSPSAASGTVTGNSIRDFTATPITYSISGTITLGGSPLSGVTVSLTGDTTGSTTTDGAGNYSFTGVNFGTNYTVTPTLAGHTFSPTSTSGTIASSVDHDFTATLDEYTISGTIDVGGSPQAGVQVVLSGGVSGSTTTDASGNYSFPNIPYGTSYVIVPVEVGYSYAPLSASGILMGNVTHDFTGTLVTFSVTGTVTLGGSPLSGVTVTLGGDVSGSTTTDGSGNYSFPTVGYAANYTVTPSLTGYTFSPTSAGGNLTANTVHDFTATLNTYTLSGTITDGSNPRAGVVVTLSGDNSDSTTTDGSGNYSFTNIAHGTNYTLTPSLANYTFTPTSASGTLTAATSENFTAIIDTFTISGTVTVGGSPQAGVTIDLSGDVSDSAVTDGSGNYSFTNVPYGTSYVLTPTSNGFTYDPSNATGVVTGNTIHDFAATVQLYNITGTITEGGSGLSGISVALTGDTSDSTTTDVNGDYSFTDVPYGTSYTVTPTVPGRTTTPTSSGGTISGAIIHDFTVDNTAPDIAPIDYQESADFGLSSHDVSLVVTNTEDDTLNYTVDVVDWYSPEGDSYYVDSFADFRMDDSGSFLQNTLGLNEKWIYAEKLDIHYIILPNGELYELEFGRPFEEASYWSDSFGTPYYDDPTLFFDVVAPSAPSGISGSVSGSTLTILMDPQVEYYDVGVVVKVSDGSLGDTEVFGFWAEGVINEAPVLTDIPDQTTAPGTTSFDVNVSVTDPELETVTLMATALDETLLPYQLDQFYDFYLTGNFHQNTAGLNEKWIPSNTTREWFVILPTGEFYRWNFSGGFASSMYVGNIGVALYTDPSGLVDVATPSGSFAPDASVSGNTITITPNGFTGDFTVMVIASDGTNSVVDFFQVSIANNAPVITPISDQNLDYSTLSVDVTAAATDPEGDSFTLNAYVLNATGVAYYLDQEYDFYLTTAGYMENAAGQGEKWIRSATSNQWFIILPNGDLYLWNGPNFAAASFAGQLDSTFHTNPALLFDVSMPGFSNVATADIVGSTLTVTRNAGFVGAIGIAVVADDSSLSSSEFFNIIVDDLPPNDPPELDPISEQLIDPVVGNVSVVASATDPNLDSLTYSAQALTDDELIYELDQFYDFFDTGNFQTGAAGYGEKWFRSNTFISNWYVILPDGSIYRWNFAGGLPASTLVAQVGTSYHDDPTTLQDVAEPTPGSFDPTASTSGSTVTVYNNGSRDSFNVRVTVTDGRASDIEFFRVTVKNTAPVLLPIVDQTMTSGVNSIDVNLSVTDAEFDAVILSATVLDVPNIAYYYDQQLDFYQAGGSFMYNAAGQGEAWIRSQTDNQWYLILPNGDLFRWNGNGFGNSTYITTLDSSYNADPTLLFDVSEPLPFTEVGESISGNTLTLTRTPAYVGVIEIMVTASDGVFTVSQRFLLDAQ